MRRLEVVAHQEGGAKYPVAEREPRSGALLYIFQPAGGNMATRAEDFRAKATEAERQAKNISDPKLRANYLELAKAWRQMAEQVEAFEKRYGAKQR